MAATLEALADLELEARRQRAIERRFRLSRLQTQLSNHACRASDSVRASSTLPTCEETPPVDSSGTGLSPDGATFEISRSGEAEIHIRLLSLSGGSDREIKVKGWPNLTGLDWSPDGKGLTAALSRPKAARFSTSI